MNENLAGKKTSPPGALSAEVELIIPFYDLDPMGVVWHGNYYKYFELARQEFMRRIGFDIDEMKASGHVWPVTKTQCSYISPLRYGMKVIVRAELEEEEHRLVFRYRITDKEKGQVLAKGSTTQVAINMTSWEMSFITPPSLINRLNEARKKRGL